MAIPIATIAAIGTMFVWHVVASLSLLTAFPPALFAFALTWAFVGWVWPFDAAYRANPPESERTGPRWLP